MAIVRSLRTYYVLCCVVAVLVGASAATRWTTYGKAVKKRPLDPTQGGGEGGTILSGFHVYFGSPMESHRHNAGLLGGATPKSTMQEHEYDPFNADQVKKNVAKLLAALSLDEYGSYCSSGVTFCIKKDSLELLVLEDGSSEPNDVLQTYVLTVANMVRFVDDLKRIRFFLEEPRGTPIKLSVKYFLLQGVASLRIRLHARSTGRSRVYVA
jgi:hypothetical protein